MNIENFIGKYVVNVRKTCFFLFENMSNFYLYIHTYINIQVLSRNNSNTFNKFYLLYEIIFTYTVKTNVFS